MRCAKTAELCVAFGLGMANVRKTVPICSLGVMPAVTLASVHPAS